MAACDAPVAPDRRIDSRGVSPQSSERSGGRGSQSLTAHVERPDRVTMSHLLPWVDNKTWRCSA
eukprot:1133815-Prymnesium_polylepis.1